MSKVFWLGIIGGIFGILCALVAILMQKTGETFDITSSTSLYYNAAGAIIFSVAGIAGGALEQRRILGGLLMIIGALGVVISLRAFGLVTCILFVPGGILILARKKEQPAVTPPITGQNEG